jgi:antitoxin ParD1/3/4
MLLTADVRERRMRSAEKIGVTMTGDMLRVIRESVDSGEYASASEVLCDAMRLWQRQRAEDAERLQAIRARIRRSLDDPRPSLTEEEVDARLEALFREAAPSRRDAAA